MKSEMLLSCLIYLLMLSRIVFRLQQKQTKGSHCFDTFREGSKSSFWVQFDGCSWLSMQERRSRRFLQRHHPQLDPCHPCLLHHLCGIWERVPLPPGDKIKPVWDHRLTLMSVETQRRHSSQTLFVERNVSKWNKETTDSQIIFLIFI